VGDLQATQLRKGTTIVFEGTPFRVLDFEHRTPGNKRGFVQTKLRNLLDGAQREVKFAAGDFVDRAVIDTREMDYLYEDGSGAVFMDVENYEQVTLGEQLMRDAKPWLSEGMRILIEMLDGNPIGLQLPKTIEMTIAETEAVVKGQTAARSNKPATLENGVAVQVPPFINAGDRVKVDPVDNRYVERVK